MDTAFESLSPSDFKQRYQFSTSFKDPVSYPPSGTFALALGQNHNLYMSDNEGWAGTTSDKSKAVRFRIVMSDGKLYLMVVGGSWDSRYMFMNPSVGTSLPDINNWEGLNPSYSLGWYKWDFPKTDWKLENNRLLAVNNSRYLKIRDSGNYLFADAVNQQDAEYVSLDWDWA